MERGEWVDGVLGYEPPLNGDGGQASALDRRGVNVRWMAATILAAAFAVLLLSGALYVALDRHVRFAVAPTAVVPRFKHQTIADADRGDRVSPRKTKAAKRPSPVRIGQLNDSGSVRPFTRLFARLADLGPDTADGEPPQNPTAAVDQPRPRPVTPSLPPIILFGTSQPQLPANVSAYAGDQPPPRWMQPIGRPLNVTSVPPSPRMANMRQHMIVARAGDTLSTILSALTVTEKDARAIAAAFAQRSSGGAVFRGGEVISVLEEAGDAVPRVLKLTVRSTARKPVSVARMDDGSYAPIVAEEPEASDISTAPGVRDLRAYSGETLHESFYALAKIDHVAEAVIAELARLCRHDFDLDGPVGRDATADILYAPDEFGQPELVFASVTAQGRHRRYYRFTAPDDEGTDYYDAQGRSVTKFLLRKPVPDGRLGDGFGWRIHPILRDRRFHEGVDYAAPYGSPIAAAGAGVVETISQEWGYGKYIRIRHDFGYETTYAHVSGFPRGLRVGDRVRQGETIAYVGSTGLSTGPHLYFEVWINGRRVDPLRIRLRSGRVLRGAPLTGFLKTERRIDELIEAPVVASASR